MKTSAKDLAAALAAQIDALARYLYPAGKRIGSEWCVGSVSGEEGTSMKIQLTGGSAGLWADFAASGYSGDALDLFAQAKGISLSEAMREARKWLGMPEIAQEQKQYSKPDKSDAARMKEDGPVFEYLVKERMITPTVINTYKVSEHSSKPGIYFPSLSPSGELVQLKWIGLERKNGKKVVMTGKGCAPSLFGWQAIDPMARSVVICEGEIDALSWATMGYPALSVPFGAKNLDWIQYDWDNLERFDEIFLSFDMDEPGKEAVREIVKRLGMHRCKVVSLPRKDANEWLSKYSPADEEVMSVLADAEMVSPMQFVDPQSYLADAMRIVRGENVGLRTNLLEGHLLFRGGETTVWTGYPGHGKSTILSQLGVEFAAKDQVVVIASMEMPIAIQIVRMAHQFYATNSLTEDQLKEFTAWMRSRIYLLDVYGMVNPTQLLELMEYGIKRYGCRHCVVDSIMKLDLPSDDYDLHRVAMNKLTTFANNFSIHMHVVAHPRKGDNDRKSVGMLDVKGSGDLINQPDNVIVVHRCKSKEMKRSAGRQADGPDGRIVIEKQRATGELAEIPTRWHGEALQYTPDSDSLSATRWSKWTSR